MKDLAGKVAVITGGASGIGLALAHRLAAERTKLALLDIEEGPLASAEAELRAAGAEVISVRTDVANAASIEAAAARVRARLGLAHIIVNNAGVAGGTGPIWKLSERDWEWTLSVNLSGVVHGIRTWVPPLLESGEEGHIVNTASIAGLTSNPWMGPYTASKHGVVAISEVLSKELELANAKIDVSVLCPGFVKTGIARSERNRPASAGPGAGASGGLASAMHALVDNGVPAEGIADAVVEAIRERRFYILTHAVMQPAIEHRHRDIAENRRPGIDPMFRQMLAGKQG